MDRGARFGVVDRGGNAVSQLVGRLVVLREVRETDLDQLRDWYNNAAIFPFMGRQEPLTDQNQRDWFNKLREDTGTRVFAVERRDTGQVIGSITLRNLLDSARRGELGILIGEASSGYGSDTIRALLSYAFGQLDLNCVSLEVRGDNRRAITAYMRAGFRPEGVLRRRMLKDGVLHDLYSMSILRDEFIQDTDEV
jgi:RimJ/RimL family protein N-acetyltransferase